MPGPVPRPPGQHLQPRAWQSPALLFSTWVALTPGRGQEAGAGGRAVGSSLPAGSPDWGGGAGGARPSPLQSFLVTDPSVPGIPRLGVEPSQPQAYPDSASAGLTPLGSRTPTPSRRCAGQRGTTASVLNRSRFPVAPSHGKLASFPLSAPGPQNHRSPRRDRASQDGRLRGGPRRSVVAVSQSTPRVSQGRSQSHCRGTTNRHRRRHSP